MSGRSVRTKIHRSCLVAIGMASTVATLDPAHATEFILTSSNVVVETPAPLFTNSTISGVFDLSDTVLPGQSFGSDSITGLKLNFAGVAATLADVQAGIAPGPLQAFGTRSADGGSFSVFDFRFSLPATVVGCSFTCAGQIIINSPIGPNDPSNFFAIDDLAGATTSVISSFTPSFALTSSAVPDAQVWTLMIAGFGLVGLRMRRYRLGAVVGRVVVN